MAEIVIHRPGGQVKRRTLSKSETLSIGTHRSSDIRLEDEDIGLLHCRIGWSKSTYEVVAADKRGVDVNGTAVRHSPLNDGDVLRIGTVDIQFDAGQVSDDSVVGLSPISDESIPTVEQPAPAPQPTATKKQEPARREKPAAAPKVSPPRAPSGGKRPPRQRKEKEEADLEFIDESDSDEFETPVEAVSAGTAATGESPSKSKSGKEQKLVPSPDDSKSTAGSPESRIDKMKAKMGVQQLRPGERESIRSPVVWGLSLGALALVLAAATFYLMTSRELSGQLFTAATDKMDESRYGPAIQLFSEFLEKYPNNSQADDAALNRDRCRILKEIGSSPSWKRGLGAVNDFITNHRDRPDFVAMYSEIVDFGKTIALGAADAAQSSANRSLLDIAREAAGVVKLHTPKDQPLDQVIEQMENAFEDAEAAIVKQEAIDATIAAVQQAIDAKDPMAALESRRQLLNRYADLEHEGQIVELLEQILDTEKRLVAREDLQREALTDERTTSLPLPVSFTHHTRARADAASEGRTVTAIAKDCCYGVDTVTGEPVWRRVIGLDTPFFPIPVAGNVPGLLLFDTSDLELVLVDSRDGTLVWRQPLNEGASGPPLIEQGQIYLPTRAHHLYKIDANSGRISAKLEFSQAIHAPPVLDAERAHVILVGDEAVLYAVSLRSMECSSATFLGHQPGSIQAPLLTMGSLLLLAENEQVGASQLRVFDTRDLASGLTQIATARVDGIVRDAPTLRGKQLFVTSDGDRIAAFTVSDDVNQETLIEGPRYMGQNPHDGPIFFLVGPGDQLWMAGSAFRKLELTANNIQLDSRTIAVGRATQPIQSLGSSVYLGRQLAHTDAVLFTHVDRDSMTSHWRTVLGPTILTWWTSADDSLIVVGALGKIARVTARDIERGGFQNDIHETLNVDDSLDEPLAAYPLSNGRTAVSARGERSTLWLTSSSGSIEQSIPLSAPLEANPVEIQSGLVLPLPGRLKLIPSDGVQVEDYVSPVAKDATPRWQQLLALDETQLIGIDTGGTLARFQRQAAPVANLKKVQELTFDDPIDVKARVVDGRIVVADSGGRLQVLDASDFAPVAEAQLPSEPSNDLWLIGEDLYLETAGNELHCIDVRADLTTRWSLALEGAGLAGAPLQAEDALIVALRDGNVLAVDSHTGAIRSRVDIAQPISLGPAQVGSHIVVPSIDGSVHRIEFPKATVEP